MSWRDPQLAGHVPEGAPRLRSVGRGIALAALVGVVAGCGGVVFELLSQFVAHYALGWMAGYVPGGPTHEHSIPEALLGALDRPLVPWLLVLVPTVGGLVSGWLVYTFAPEAEGHGTDSAIDAYHNRKGVIRSRVPIVKMFASAVTLGTGGSGGREGPIAQIGAGFGSFLATRLGLSDSERRVLLAAGIGGGIGAIFHAPLAGAIFAIEVLYRDPDFEAEALIPAFIATTVAYCMFALIISFAFGFDAFGSLFSVAPGLRFDNPALLLPLAGLAIAMALAALVYTKMFYGLRDLFRRIPMPRMLKPALGAMLTGLLAVGIYHGLNAAGFSERDQFDALAVLSFGYGFLQDILNPAEQGVALSLTVLLLVGFGKMVTTSLTIGSGGSGGVFGPSMVIGGSLGAAVGLVANMWLPDLVTDQQLVAFVLLGMAGFFAAAAKTPVSTLIMVSELTGSYALLLPAMWVCALSYVLSRGWTIYREQVKNRLESPAHRGDFIVDILEGMTVRDAMAKAGRSFMTVPYAMPLNDVMTMITGTRQSSFPVVDDDEQYLGLFSLNDIRQFLYNSEMGQLATAHDLAATTVSPVLSSTALGDAIGRFAESPYEELPVVEPEEPGKVIGMLRRMDVIATYNAQLLETRREPTADPPTA